MMKFMVGFYGRGDLSRASLVAECVVDALDISTAKTAAIAQLEPQYPALAQCRFWHASGHSTTRTAFRR